MMQNRLHVPRCSFLFHKLASICVFLPYIYSLILRLVMPNSQNILIIALILRFSYHIHLTSLVIAAKHPILALLPSIYVLYLPSIEVIQTSILYDYSGFKAVFNLRVNANMKLMLDSK